MRIQDVAAKSGDSKLVDWSFAGGMLEFRLELDAFDGEGSFSVPTELVRAWEPGPAGHPSRTCRIELIELSKVLASEKERWTAPERFESLMEQSRTGLSLVYGLSKKEAGWLLRLVGSRPLLACVVADLGEVRVELPKEGA